MAVQRTVRRVQRTKRAVLLRVILRVGSKSVRSLYGRTARSIYGPMLPEVCARLMKINREQ
jgi:hypothetical protein